MARLKRDERACPLCGETIKAVAVRCRYCHADVEPLAAPRDPSAQGRTKIQRTLPGRAAAEPAIDPEGAPDPGSSPEAAVEPGAGLGSASDVEEAEEESQRSALTIQSVGAALRTNLTVVLAALVLAAGIGVGVSWWRADQPSAVAPNGALVGDEARTQVLVEAADLSTRALSYNYKTLDNDMEVARARMTPGFQKEYDATMAQVRDNTVKNKITLQAVAMSSAIISATENKAEVLLFLNQTTESEASKNQQLSRNSLVVTLTRGDGDWMMSKLTALG